MKKTTVFAPVMSVVWDLVDSAGFDPEPLFRQVQLDPRLMRDPNARIPAEKQSKLMALAAQVTDDRCLGLKAATHWHPSHLGALGYAWLSSCTLATALGRLSRYSRILNDCLRIGIVEGESEIAVEIGYTVPWGDEIIARQANMAVLTDMCRLNYGEDFDPLKVEFAHPAPPCKGDYFEFFRCSVEFEASANRLTLSRESYERQLRGSNPQMAQLHDRVIIDYLAKLSEDNLIERLKGAIIDQLPSGDVSDSSVAETLYMTVRTLQRRLQGEGTSYREVLEQVRRELANQYILDTSLSISEISFLLGFSEVSGFSRAFKRWTGNAPSAFRHVA